MLRAACGTGSTHTNGRTRLQKNQMNNWLPRVGVAYQLNAKTEVNGGFGIYTFPWNVDSYASCCLGNAISSSGSESDSTGSIAPVAFLSGTGNENPQGAKGKSINALYVNSPTAPDAYNGQNVSYMQYDQADPTQLQLEPDRATPAHQQHGGERWLRRRPRHKPSLQQRRQSDSAEPPGTERCQFAALSGVPGHQRILNRKPHRSTMRCRPSSRAALPTA